jgi:hypothetical protein
MAGKGNMANMAKGKKFQKGQSGNPKGRPKKFVTTLKRQGYKLSEINDAINILLECGKAELENVVKGNHTVLEINIAAAILADIKQGRVVTLETILSRVYGRPKNEIQANINATGNVKLILPDNETSDEA